MIIQNILTLASGLTFLTYGLLCLFHGHMREEFKRYGLSKFRKLTGGLEFFGGLGTIVGLYLPILFLISTLGLAALMFLGIVVRVRVGDGPKDIAPALILMIINIYLFLQSVGLY